MRKNIEDGSRDEFSVMMESLMGADESGAFHKRSITVGEKRMLKNEITTDEEGLPYFPLSFWKVFFTLFDDENHPLYYPRPNHPVPPWTQWAYNYETNSSNVLTKNAVSVKVPIIVSKCLAEGHVYRGHLHKGTICYRCKLPFILWDEKELFPWVTECIMGQIKVLNKPKKIPIADSVKVKDFYEKHMKTLKFINKVRY